MKKSIALILALVMLAALVSCGGSGNETTSTTPTPTKTSSTPSPQKDTDDDDTAGSGLPIVDNPVTYTIWNGPMSTEANIQSADEIMTYQLIEKMTNIHINWLHPSTGPGQAQEQFNLIVASQTLPDVFFTGNAIGSGCYYIGGYDAYIENDTILDLSELIEQYAPNYNALRNSDDSIRKNTMTDIGNVPYFRTISPSREPSWRGFMARQDWLDKSGSGIVANNVNTYDEFYEMLKAIKEYSGTASMYFSTLTGINEFFTVGFGVVTTYSNRDGTAVYGPTDPGFLEYLTTMNKWYDEGLIDPEFFTRQSFFTDSNMLYNGDVGVYEHFWTMPDQLDSLIVEEGANMQGIRPPVKNKGDIRSIAYSSVPHTVLGGGNATVTNNSSDVVPLIKWLDFFYAEENYLLTNWGVEDETYVIGANGNPEWTELIYANPDGMSIGGAQVKYTGSSIHPKLYDWTRGLTPLMTERCLTIGPDVWDRDYKDTQTMPEVAVSTEESAEYSALINDIKTYVEENVVAFIIGAKPLSEFNSFVSQIESMNIARCTEIQQQALERYYDR